MEVALQLLPATIAGILYALRTHTLAATPRAVPTWRKACFYGGLTLIVVSLTAMGPLADELFWAHMVEHLIVGDVGALLLVLGPHRPAARARPAHPASSTACACSRIRRSRFPLWALDLYVWHLPALHEAAVRHGGVHALQHALLRRPSA